MLILFNFPVLKSTVFVIVHGKQGLWLRLLKLGATDDPLSSFEYGTILGMLLIKNYILYNELYFPFLFKDFDV